MRENKIERSYTYR